MCTWLFLMSPRSTVCVMPRRQITDLPALRGNIPSTTYISQSCPSPNSKPDSHEPCDFPQYEHHKRTIQTSKKSHFPVFSTAMTDLIITMLARSNDPGRCPNRRHEVIKSGHLERRCLLMK
ncbi:Contactin-Associated Protein-Like 3B [Manis pentadactyla]|nr:Contactin-Associated Protein-Like 3B [Manis pentadactyla]